MGRIDYTTLQVLTLHYGSMDSHHLLWQPNLDTINQNCNNYINGLKTMVLPSFKSPCHHHHHVVVYLCIWYKMSHIYEKLCKSCYKKFGTESEKQTLVQVGFSYKVYVGGGYLLTHKYFHIVISASNTEGRKLLMTNELYLKMPWSYW